MNINYQVTITREYNKMPTNKIWRIKQFHMECNGNCILKFYAKRTSIYGCKLGLAAINDIYLLMFRGAWNISGGGEG